MSDSPYFSVIIPTYNRAIPVKAAIESVLHQSFSDFELLIVDDGSTDHTAQIVAEICSEDKRVKYIYQQNAERCAARNNGIAHAKGRYICFLDSDDAFLQEHLENFNRELTGRRDSVELLFCKVVSETNYGWHTMTNNDSVQDFILLNSLTCQQACVHRSILTEFKFNESIKIGEDRDLWLRISTKFPVRTIADQTIIINDLGDRTTDVKNLKNAQENLKNLRSSILETPKGISDRVRRKITAAAYHRLSKSYLANEKHFWAIFFSVKSLLIFRDKYAPSIVMFILEVVKSNFQRKPLHKKS
jgi:glycosyltransferase involved in cell wall biosynthesis